MSDDWLTLILKNMIINKAVMVDLGKVKITRTSDDLKSFNFQISFYKSLFPDILTNEEKSTRWIEEVKQ